MGEGPAKPRPRGEAGGRGASRGGGGAAGGLGGALRWRGGGGRGGGLGAEKRAEILKPRRAERYSRLVSSSWAPTDVDAHRRLTSRMSQLRVISFISVVKGWSARRIHGTYGWRLRMACSRSLASRHHT